MYTINTINICGRKLLLLLLRTKPQLHKLLLIAQCEKKYEAKFFF